MLPAHPEPTRNTHAPNRNARNRFRREQIPKKNTHGSNKAPEKLAEPPVFEHDATVVIVIDAVAGLVPFSVTLDGENPQFVFAGSDEHDNVTA